jgi:hypothetical protein
MKPAPKRSSAMAVVLVFFGLAGPVYCGAYLWARATNEP